MKSIICLSLLFAVSFASNINLRNNCPFTIWPGIQGNPGHGQPNGGGFELGRGQSHNLALANNWAGRIWARTGCNGAGHCVTGDCGKFNLEVNLKD